VNHKQNIFAFIIGAILGIGGSLLASSAITDWSLATVGLCLIALAGAQALQRSPSNAGTIGQNV